MHPTPAVGGEPLAARRAPDPGARGPRPRLVRRSGRLDRRGRRRRVLRRAALRAAERRRRPLLRRQRHRARLRPCPRAGRDRGQAPGAAAAAQRLSAAATASHTRRWSSTLPARSPRTSMMPERARAERALERRAEGGNVLDALVPQAVERRPRVEKSRPVGVATCVCRGPRRPPLPAAAPRAPSPPRRRAGSRRSRRRRCRAARSSAAGRAGSLRAGRRCRGRARRRRSTARPGPVAAAAAPNAAETVPSMPFAPRLQSTARRVAAHRPEGLDVAHRHRGGDEQRRLLGQQHAELRRHRAARSGPPARARR